MKYVFKKDGWSMDGLTYAYSIRFAPMPEFNQQEDYIENIPAPQSRDGYSYVSLVSEEKLRPNAKISTHCAFSLNKGKAAPLFILSKELMEKDGSFYYGDYLEVVLHANGINVWTLWMEDGDVKIRNLLRVRMPVATDEIHDFALEVQKDRFVINMDGHVVELYCDEIFDSFHLGITGCEGHCRFYDLEIEQCE